LPSLEIKRLIMWRCRMYDITKGKRCLLHLIMENDRVGEGSECQRVNDLLIQFVITIIIGFLSANLWHEFTSKPRIIR